MSLIIGSDPAQLERALAETDGLLAGMRILDKAEPLDQDRDRDRDAGRPGNTILYDESRFLLDYPSEASWVTTTAGHHDSPPSQFHGPIGPMDFLPQLRTGVIPAVSGVNGQQNLVRRESPSRVSTWYDNTSADGDAPTQWAVLRRLRRAMVGHHRRLLGAIANSPLPAASKLAHAYPNAKAMREKGILTFRDILHGVSPTGLAGVFAFASLSYAMSALLLERGRLKREHILLGSTCGGTRSPTPKSARLFPGWPGRCGQKPRPSCVNRPKGRSRIRRRMGGCATTPSSSLAARALISSSGAKTRWCRTQMRG